MKISVVIPMYNSSKSILNTLASIDRQSMRSLIHEIIVVNDGSTDDSVLLVSEYKKHHTHLPIILIIKENGGVSTARNAGMKEATGDWIAFLDSDDEWLENKIEVQSNILESHPEIDFLGGPFNEKPLKILNKKIETLHKAMIYEILIRNFPQPSTVILKKRIFDELGGFDENQRYAEDGNYFLKICGKYNLYYWPELLIVYDGGKRGYGIRGLSSNLEKMYEGNVKNIIEMKEMKYISFPFYVLMRFYHYAKYIRRILISKIKR